LYFLKRIWAPEIFQGRNKHKNYFEGWYYKLISRDRQNVMAVIPGVALGNSLKDSHAFIQVIDAIKGKVDYFRYNFEAFRAEKNIFGVAISNNFFNGEKIILHLENAGRSIKGELNFKNIVKFPKTLLNPGIMGPFSFLPWMECYHGIVNIHQKIEGQILINEDGVDFTEGEGYIEKDWGCSFPENWIWLQANHFEKEGSSFMLSIATIPWLGKSFTGFISFLRTENKFYRLATYNHSKIKKIHFEKGILSAIIEGPDTQMNLLASFTNGGILKAPKNGVMDREIEESISAELKLTFIDKHGKVIFEGHSSNTGMEIAGDFSKLMSWF
jgi:tocopherol cyclase